MESTTGDQTESLMAPVPETHNVDFAAMGTVNRELHEYYPMLQDMDYAKKGIVDVLKNVNYQAMDIPGTAAPTTGRKLYKFQESYALQTHSIDQE